MSERETVLVTGSRGFTGRHVCKALTRAGWAVHGVVHGPAEEPDESSCDLTEPEQVRMLIDTVRPDRVIHLAGLAFVDTTDPLSFYRVNVFGTLNLLAALGGHADCIRKVVIASSAGIYGRPEVERIDESHCPAPVNHYGCSKLAMEHMVATWFDRLPIIITRPFNYTGPGQNERFLVAKIAGHFIRRESTIELGNLDVSREFSDVRDVAEAYRRLLTVDDDSLHVNICSGIPVSLSSVLESCERITGHQLAVQVNAQLVRRNEIPVLAGDPSRLDRLIGPRPLISFEQTLSDLCGISSRANQ